MMPFSNFEYGNPEDNDSNNGQLLRDVEEISKALYLDDKTQKNSLISSSNLWFKSANKSPLPDPKSKPKPGFIDDDEWLCEEQKPSSIWDWKPLKALSYIRRRKLTCCFFCHVHCIENLPSDFDGISMSVHWKRKDSVFMTLPCRVSNGMVEFEETLVNKCAVYGMKNGPGNFVKYEPKHFLLYASVFGAGRLDIGKHWTDLTRLLPLTIDELEEDKCSGKWSTSFKLTGKAKGAMLHVSFGFLVTKDGFPELGSNMNLPRIVNLERNGLNRMSFVANFGPGRDSPVLRRVGSVPSSLTNASSMSCECTDVKFDWPEEASDFSDSVNLLYGKLEEGSGVGPEKFDMVFKHLESLELVPNLFAGSEKDFNRAEHDDAQFTVIEKGVELEWSPEEGIKFEASTDAEDVDISTVEVIDVTEIFKGEGISSDEKIKSNKQEEVSGLVVYDALVDKHSVFPTKESNAKKEVLNLHQMLNSESSQLELSEDEIHDEITVHHNGSKMVKSLSLDDVSKLVVNDFVNLLQETCGSSTPNSNGDLESPRERLLKQFEEDMMTSGSFLLNVDVQEDEAEFDYGAPSVSSSDYIVEGLDLLPFIDTAGQESTEQYSTSEMKAKVLERLETQSLMQRWGFNEEVFQSSPHYNNGGFGSPIFVPAEKPVGLPPLGEGLEPLLILKNGGLLRSMSPLLFGNAKNSGSLVMQASKPVVLPAVMGSDILEIFQCIASVGTERLTKKVHELMPLEELSGKIMQQLAEEALCKAEGLERPADSLCETDIKIEVKRSSHFPGCYLNSSPTCSDMGSDYVLAKDLAALFLNSIEVLTIQGLRIQSRNSDHDAPCSIKVKSASEVTSGHKIAYFDESPDLLGVTGTANNIIGLLDLSISLDEWLRLDSGIFGDKNQLNEHKAKVLRAHHAKSAGEEYMPNEPGSCGFLGDSLTVALTVQLRDPVRNYEPVGAPLLGLVQLERVFRPSSEINYSNCPEESTNLEEEIDGTKEDDKNIQECVCSFIVKEVHIAGLNIENGNREIWASRRQQQSGCRWLLASGLTKNQNRRFSKSRSIVKLSTQFLSNPRTRNLLWSISRHVHGVIADTSEFSSQHLLTRNPDFIFPE